MKVVYAAKIVTKNGALKTVMSNTIKIKLKFKYTLIVLSDALE